MMIHYPLLLVLALLVAAADAQTPQDAELVSVTLSSFAFTPETLELQSGRPYRLRLVNTASGGHNFVAREFLDTATIAPADRPQINDGRIEVSGGESVDVRLTLSEPGRYSLHCSHFGHSVLGMTGEIIVR